MVPPKKCENPYPRIQIFAALSDVVPIVGTESFSTGRESPVPRIRLDARDFLAGVLQVALRAQALVALEEKACNKQGMRLSFLETCRTN